MASISGQPAPTADRKANEALTKFRFVNLLSSDTDKVEHPDAQADDDICFGITVADYASGAHATMVVDGIFKLELGETIAVDALIAPGVQGVGAVPDAGNFVRCRALRAGVSGDVIEVRLLDQQVVA